MLAFCTNSNIFDTVEFSNVFVTFTVNTPVLLIIPLSISFSSFIFLGTDSPVNADVSIKDSPSNIIPSSGIFSPGFTIISSPTQISLGDTLLIPPSVFKLA